MVYGFFVFGGGFAQNLFQEMMEFRITQSIGVIGVQIGIDIVAKFLRSEHNRSVISTLIDGLAFLIVLIIRSNKEMTMCRIKTVQGIFY